MDELREGSGNADSMEERRSYIRTKSDISLNIEVVKDGQESGIPCLTKNISATGLMLVAQTQLPVGSDIKIDMNIPGALNPVHCIGKIIWINPAEETGKYSTGVKFVKIEEDNKNTFLKFLCDTIYKASRDE